MSGVLNAVPEVNQIFRPIEIEVCSSYIPLFQVREVQIRMCETTGFIICGGYSLQMCGWNISSLSKRKEMQRE
jgi:hypothetical protein